MLRTGSCISLPLSSFIEELKKTFQPPGGILLHWLTCVLGRYIFRDRPWFPKHRCNWTIMRGREQKIEPTSCDRFWNWWLPSQALPSRRGTTSSQLSALVRAAVLLMKANDCSSTYYLPRVFSQPSVITRLNVLWASKSPRTVLLTVSIRNTMRFYFLLLI